MGFLIAIIAICLGASIPISAIYFNHVQTKEKIRLQYISKEIELEQLKLQNYERETEMLRLDLEQSKQLLIEQPNSESSI